LEFATVLCVAVVAIWASGLAVIAAIDFVRGRRRAREGGAAACPDRPDDPRSRPYGRLTNPATGPL